MSRRLDKVVQFALGLLWVKEGVRESFDFALGVDPFLVQLVEQVVDRVRVRDVGQYGGAVVGEQGIEHVFGLVDEIQHEGLVAGSALIMALA